MSTYAIGDLQGCYHSFRHLLQQIRFHPQHDTLWLVGDLVNRGSGSLEVLRWIYQHQHAVVTVLGNHDLHTLVVAEGIVQPHRSDTLQALFAATDSAELLHWLRQQPLIHSEGVYTLVHAGLLPQWDITQALALGAEVANMLSGEHYRDFLQAMYGNQPRQWSDELSGYDRLRVITNAMTRLRLCTAEGEMEFKFKGELGNVPEDYLPWFDVPGRASRDSTILFGHWSALGLIVRPDMVALDTGCLWGRSLTAMRLEDRQIFQVPCSSDDIPQCMHFTD